MMEKEHEHASTRGRTAILVVRVVGALVLVLVITLAIVFYGRLDWSQIFAEHFAATVGLPMAAAAAFVLVVLLQQGEAPLEFEGLGFKFKGSSGQILLWVVCFLAISGAIALLW